MTEVQNSGKIGPRKEMSMEMRLLLALLLTVPILFLGPYLFGPQPQTKTAPKAPPQTTNSAAQTATKAPPAESAAVAPAAAAPAAAPAKALPGTPQEPAPAFILNTDLYHIIFSNQGAIVKSWELKTFRGNDKKPLNLVNDSANWVLPFTVNVPSDKALEQKLNWAYYKQTVEPDGLGVTFEYTDGHADMVKKFRFEKDSFVSLVSSALTVDGKPVPNYLQWRGGFGDLTVANPSLNVHAIYFDNNASGFLGLTQGKLEEKGPPKDPVQTGGSQSFAGVSDTYFAAVFLPQNEGSLSNTVFADYVNSGTGTDQKKIAFPGIAVSGGDVNNFRLFVGPKDIDLLKHIDPKLEHLISFGWTEILAKPLFLIVNWTNDNIVHSFGWAIILCTVFLNVLLFPLRISSMKSMRKMQALKPQIDAINAKYKGMSVRDPRKSEQTQETMDLYKKNGVNPMGGCLPMVLQFPLIIAFYYVFKVSVEMRGASWLWVGDLSQPEMLPIRILPVILIATQFLTQKMMPQPGTDPNQQKMTMFMPLIFGFMFYNFSSGLVLYYLTSNLVGVGLQWFFNKTDTARLAAESVLPAPKKKPGKK